MAVAPEVLTGTGTKLNIVVGLSGGVDSSVAALLLKQQGHDVRGIFMKNWEADDSDRYCSSREDFLDAVAVAERLDISIDAVNFSALYQERVFQHFLTEYRAGRTPNPDILCNTEIKFKAFLEHAWQQGARYVATGHYARIDCVDGMYHLCKADDWAKDQSYFLHGLTQTQLSRIMFPLGNITKSEVRQLALDAGLITYDKKDSTGICFIGERPFREFLGRYLPAQAGEIRTTGGRILGHHPGVIYYTLGQREGLGIGGVKGAREAPWYVLEKDVANNILYVGQNRDDPRLLSRGLTASNISWSACSPPTFPYRCHAKTRYRQPDQVCTILSNSVEECRVLFDHIQWAVTPGQYVVFYQGQQCLGGGVITATTAA